MLLRVRSAVAHLGVIQCTESHKTCHDSITWCLTNLEGRCLPHFPEARRRPVTEVAQCCFKLKSLLTEELRHRSSGHVECFLIAQWTRNPGTRSNNSEEFSSLSKGGVAWAILILGNADNTARRVHQFAFSQKTGTLLRHKSWTWTWCEPFTPRHTRESEL
jgi:hypothetical protein